MAAINQVGNSLTGLTGTGTFVGANTPTLITPVLGVATGTSVVLSGKSMANNMITGFATTATAAATTTLLATSPQNQEFTGSTTQTVVMPVTSTMVAGQQFYIINNSSGVVTVQSSGANTIQAMAASTSLLLTVVNTGVTTAAGWQAAYVADTGLAGAVLLTPSGDQTITTGNLIVATGNIQAAANNIIAGANGATGRFTSHAAGLNLGTLQLYGANNAGSYDVVITNASFGQSTTLTLPDPGASSANVILSSGAGQTIGNGLTLTTPVIGAASATSIAFTSTSGVIGTTTNNSAAAGSVGEYAYAQVLEGAGVAMTTATITPVTSISLTAGDWDLWGNITYFPGDATTTYAYSYNWINIDPNTLADPALANFSITSQSAFSSAQNLSAPPPCTRVSLATTTTVYLLTRPIFAVSTLFACGFIAARRRR